MRDAVEEVNEWPTKLDVAGAVFALFTIQYTYKLPVIDIARGMLGNRQTLARLTIEDIKHMVVKRLEDQYTISHFPGKDYALAIEWVEGAIRYIATTMQY